MKRPSFRIVVVFTLLTSITLFSFISFAVYNRFLKKELIRIHNDNIEFLSLLRNQYYFSIGEHNGKVIKSLLKNTENEKNVLKVYLANPKSSITFPEKYSSLGNDTNEIRKIYLQKEGIKIVPRSKNQLHFDRVFIRLQNNPTCQSCHPKEEKYLGIIIMDIVNTTTDDIIHYTQSFSLLYTLFLLLSIFGVVGFLHYRYIRKSLGNFREVINMINEGKLDSRLTIPEVKELGSLGKNFNEMVDKFDKAQRELQHYHLQEMQNAKKLATIGEMSARIAHEIRNPVTGIVRAIEIIIKESKETSDKPILEEIQRQGTRVEQAISNLLKYSRPQEVQLQEGDINDLVRSLVFFLENQAFDKKIHYRTDLQPGLPAIRLDFELIENVLMNLSMNAIKSFREEGTVIYRTTLDIEEKHILISVQDDGPGIPRTIGDEIFKPFFTTHTKGTGLGLAISKDIIEKHTGKIWFANNQDKGCTFYISLPVNKY